MDLKPLSYKQNFEGNVIVRNKINITQNSLFNLHRPALEAKIKDLPFDLFVEQSKSRKTITLSTNVKDSKSYFVRKNEQNFEQIADFVIEDAKKKSELYKRQVKANNLFNIGYSAYISAITGNFKEARKLEKEFAKKAVKDFEIYKLLPKVVLQGAPKDVIKLVNKNSTKYWLYKLFSPKTKEEKQLAKLRKQFIKELKAENKQIQTVEVKIPNMYYF